MVRKTSKAVITLGVDPRYMTIPYPKVTIDETNWGFLLTIASQRDIHTRIACLTSLHKIFTDSLQIIYIHTRQWKIIQYCYKSSSVIFQRFRFNVSTHSPPLPLRQVPIPHFPKSNQPAPDPTGKRLSLKHAFQPGTWCPTHRELQHGRRNSSTWSEVREWYWASWHRCIRPKSHQRCLLPMSVVRTSEYMIQFGFTGHQHVNAHPFIIANITMNAEIVSL